MLEYPAVVRHVLVRKEASDIVVAGKDAQLLMPELSWEAFFETGVGDYDSMQFGQSWCDNLVLSAPVSRHAERSGEAREMIRLDNLIPLNRHTWH